MLETLKKLRERWANWCGDYEMEMKIRQHLSANGYFGRTAQLRNVRLVAVQRPGWLQVFRFDVTARVAHAEHDGHPDQPAEYHDLFGLIRDDARKGSAVRVFAAAEDRAKLYAEWAEGLIQLRGARGLQEIVG
jgi:hypothetical protein